MSEPNCSLQNVNNEAASVIGVLIPRELLWAHHDGGARGSTGRLAGMETRRSGNGFGEVALEERRMNDRR